MTSSERAPPGQHELLSGEVLEEYCLQQGLCPLCAQTKTHVRSGPYRLKLSGSSKKNNNRVAWKPLTTTLADAIQQQQEKQQPQVVSEKKSKKKGLFQKKSSNSNNNSRNNSTKESEILFDPNNNNNINDSNTNNNYLVYKGFCVRPGCFTLDQAKRLSGELGPFMTPIGTNGNSTEFGYYCFANTDETTNGKVVEPTEEAPKKKGMSKLFGKSKKKKDLAAFDSAMTGFSNLSSFPAQQQQPTLSKAESSTTQAISDELSVSGTSINSRKHRTGKIRRRGQYDDQSNGGSIVDDDDVSIGSAMTSESKVRRSLKELLVQQQEQGPEAVQMEANSTLLLDLSHTRLHHVHVVELVQALDVSTSLQTLILENCKLNDNEVEVIGKGLLGVSGARPPLSLVRLSLRSNKIGNRGAVGLCPYFQKTSTLQELDLSKNQIGSRGASSILHALRDNTNHGDKAVPITMINFAHNEIWDVDDGTFFARNVTLQMLNLEGNFIHDEGVQAITDGLRANAQYTQLTELFLGWNGIGDEGCLHLARMIESNSKLERLGLGENDITSVGARALLNALANNKTLVEISGLYHNQIDRKFVIEAISRILYSHMEILAPDLEAARRKEYEKDKRASMNATDTLVEPLGSHLPIPDEISEGELDWADRLYNDETELVDTGVPLGEVQKEDQSMLETKSVDDDEVLSEPTLGKYAPMPPPKVLADRLVLLEAAPLAHLERGTAIRKPIPLHDFDHETSIIKGALEGSTRLDATIDLDVQQATSSSLSSLFASGRTRVLHFTGYGHPQHVLALEDDDGYLDDTFALDKLSSMVQSANPPIQLVVVNSFHSGRIGKAFLDAGVPHVVCCHHPEIFRDKAANSFLKNFYRALAIHKSLKQAFYHAQESVRVEEISKDIDRYVLLPRKPEQDAYHDVPIFFQHAVPPNSVDEDADAIILEDARKLLPKVPKYFVGREVDMCKVLDALRSEKIVRIGGSKGIGKTSLAAATALYVQNRPKSFEFDDVFWLPIVRGVVPEEDTLFADLVEYTSLMMRSGDNVSLEAALECRERIEIELEGRSSLLVIDSRKFESESSYQSLEFFLNELLDSDLDVKILLINSDGDEEDATIRLGPIDFRSTALLFGAMSRFITANGCPAAQSPEEYADLIVPPSIQKMQTKNGSLKETVSMRRERLMSVMGDGIPYEVLRAGKTMQANVFIRLIGMANTPEVQIDSMESLEAAIDKWTAKMESAIANMNFFRALDLQQVVKELNTQRSKFPSLEDMILKEQELHRKHTLCFKTRRYDEGNRLKREILALKREIMREKRRLTKRTPIAGLTESQTTKLADIQKQMESIMKLANSSFSSLTDLQEAPDKNEAVFRLGSAYHSCEVRIYPGNVEDFDPQGDLGASVCWTNESCVVGKDGMGKALLMNGGENLIEDIETLPAIAKTPWGTTKCGTGNAVIVGPGNYDDLQVHCVILAVGPMSPNRNEVLEEGDEDSLHYITVMMRSCIRSSFILAKHSQVQSIAIPTLTTKVGSPTYESTLLTNLKLLVEEARFSDLNTLHIVASSSEESSKLIEMALTMGLTISTTSSS